MKIAEIRNLSRDELSTKINDTKEELMNLRFQLATGSLTDYTRLQQTRRLVARMMTIINELENSAKEGEG